MSSVIPCAAYCSNGFTPQMAVDLIGVGCSGIHQWSRAKAGATKCIYQATGTR